MLTIRPTVNNGRLNARLWLACDISYKNYVSHNMVWSGLRKHNSRPINRVVPYLHHELLFLRLQCSLLCINGLQATVQS